MVRLGGLEVYPGAVIDISAIKVRFEALAPYLDERGRCLRAASEARAAGRGGLEALFRATGVARLRIQPANFHGEWNSTILPGQPDGGSGYPGSGP